MKTNKKKTAISFEFKSKGQRLLLGGFSLFWMKDIFDLQHFYWQRVKQVSFSQMPLKYILSMVSSPNLLWRLLVSEFEHSQIP